MHPTMRRLQSEALQHATGDGRCATCRATAHSHAPQSIRRSASTRLRSSRRAHPCARARIHSEHEAAHLNREPSAGAQLHCARAQSQLVHDGSKSLEQVVAEQRQQLASAAADSAALRDRIATLNEKAAQDERARLRLQTDIEAVRASRDQQQATENALRAQTWELGLLVEQSERRYEGNSDFLRAQLSEALAQSEQLKGALEEVQSDLKSRLHEKQLELDVCMQAGSDMEERLCQLMDLLIEMGTSTSATRVVQQHAAEVLAKSRLIEMSPQLLKVRSAHPILFSFPRHGSPLACSLVGSADCAQSCRLCRSTSFQSRGGREAKGLARSWCGSPEHSAARTSSLSAPRKRYPIWRQATDGMLRNTCHCQ